MHWHRKPRRTGLLVAVIALAGALSAMGIAFGDTLYTGDGDFSPHKLPKDKRAPITLTVILSNTNDNANGVPDPLTHVQLNFDDDGTISTKGLPTCNPSKVVNTTTQIALQRCGKAKVGTGKAIIRIPVNTSFQEFTAQMTLFNGPKKGKNPTLVLHNRQDDLGVTLVLQGTIKNSKAGPDYGKLLDVPVSDLPAGAELVSLETKVHKTWKVHGKTVSYVSSSCHDKNHKLDVLGKVTLGGGATSPQTAHVQKPCQVKH
jgi:hypothetical protein